MSKACPAVWHVLVAPDDGLALEAELDCGSACGELLPFCGSSLLPDERASQSKSVRGAYAACNRDVRAAVKQPLHAFYVVRSQFDVVI
jgi:hypothetical protein